MNNLIEQEKMSREQKFGRRAMLIQQRDNMRVHIDAILKTTKDYFGIRDVEFSYVEKVDYKKIHFLLHEASQKNDDLQRINKEIALLNAALGNTESEL